MNRALFAESVRTEADWCGTQVVCREYYSIGTTICRGLRCWAHHVLDLKQLICLGGSAHCSIWLSAGEDAFGSSFPWGTLILLQNLCNRERSEDQSFTSRLQQRSQLRAVQQLRQSSSDHPPLVLGLLHPLLPTPPKGRLSLSSQTLCRFLSDPLPQGLLSLLRMLDGAPHLLRKHSPLLEMVSTATRAHKDHKQAPPIRLQGSGHLVAIHPVEMHPAWCQPPLQIEPPLGLGLRVVVSMGSGQRMQRGQCKRLPIRTLS